MGRQICVCLSSSNPVDRCNPWRDISSGVGNSSAQTVDDHVLVNGRTRKRSAAGGWSEAEVCAEELPLHGRPCMEDNAAASGRSLVQRRSKAPSGRTCCWLEAEVVDLYLLLNVVCWLLGKALVCKGYYFYCFWFLWADVFAATATYA